MSRSGYVESDNDREVEAWRGAVNKAICGKRGQAFLREMLTVLDTMADKRLISGELLQADGEVCAIGAVGVRRGMSMADLDPDEPESVAHEFGIALSLACEIVDENDEGPCQETPEQRWQRMRDWVAAHLFPGRGKG